MTSHVIPQRHARLTFGKWLLGVWFAPNKRDERVIAVVHLVPKLQLRALDVLGMDELVAADLFPYRVLQSETGRRER